MRQLPDLGPIAGAMTRRQMAALPIALLAAGSAVAQTSAPAGSVSPEQFGASGNGVDDDSAAINACLATGRPTWLRSGATYAVRRPVRPPSGAQLLSDGRATLAGYLRAPVIEVDGGSDITLRGFRITGRRDQFTQNYNHGVMIDWRKDAGGNVRVENLVVDNVAGAGIIALASKRTRSSGLSITGCEVHDVGAHGICAQDYIDDVLITRCRVERTSLMVPDRPGITGSRFGAGVTITDNICIGSPRAQGRSVHGVSTDQCEEVTVTGNQCTDWTGYGIEIGGVTRGVISGNDLRRNIYGIAGSGVRDQFASRTVRIADNSITDSLACGIFFFMTDGRRGARHRDIAIVNNVITRVNRPADGIGLYLNAIDGLQITGNRISRTQKSGVYLNDCSNVTIDRLTLDRVNLTKAPTHGGLLVRWTLEQPASPKVGRIDFVSVAGLRESIATTARGAPPPK